MNPNEGIEGGGFENQIQVASSHAGIDQLRTQSQATPAPPVAAENQFDFNSLGGDGSQVSSTQETTTMDLSSLQSEQVSRRDQREQSFLQQNEGWKQAGIDITKVSTYAQAVDAVVELETKINGGTRDEATERLEKLVHKLEGMGAVTVDDVKQEAIAIGSDTFKSIQKNFSEGYGMSNSESFIYALLVTGSFGGYSSYSGRSAESLGQSDISRQVFDGMVKKKPKEFAGYLRQAIYGEGKLRNDLAFSQKFESNLEDVYDGKANSMVALQFVIAELHRLLFNEGKDEENWQKLNKSLATAMFPHRPNPVLDQEVRRVFKDLTDTKVFLEYFGQSNQATQANPSPATGEVNQVYSDAA